ncbi:transmembrane protein 211 isoform X2 [Carcharodon carcharias]|uniref:transmembrane protein 211 isoform X2 n=1 Tax=Carcharodon carcharias TaxID=13397 RepID=UPI001B7E7BDA|nr:transmembrane protein 211 isoform X2 [Carcharodon carcharias]
MHSLLDRKKKEAGTELGFVDIPADSLLPQAQRMWTCVGCLWVLLSSCLVAVCSFSFISPAWIVKEKSKDSVSFGLLWHCSETVYNCYTFGGLGNFADIPSGSWQTSAVLCSGGCVLLATSALLAIVTVFLPSGQCEKRICTLAGYMQTTAVFIMASGLLVYPFGLNSPLVQKYCGNSSIYHAADCQIGWGYMLAIVGVMLAVFLPFFSKYAPKESSSPTPIPTIL